MPAARSIGLLVVLLLGVTAPPVRAQTATPPAAAPGPTGGIVRAPPAVDPGMARTPPRIASRSTPVIHPRRLRAPRGSVEVVPK